MAIKIKLPFKPVVVPTPGFARTVPGQLEPYMPGDAIPVADVIEKNSESVWALWSDAVEGPPEMGVDDHPKTQLMGLDELPKDGDR
jgi:hypothetical protein